MLLNSSWPTTRIWPPAGVTGAIVLSAPQIFSTTTAIELLELDEELLDELLEELLEVDLDLQELELLEVLELLLDVLLDVLVEVELDVELVELLEQKGVGS